MVAPMSHRTGHFPASPARGLAALALASLLCACSPNADEARAHHDAQLHKDSPAAGLPAGTDTVDMVSAVSAADVQPPVHLKFRLHDAPHVGEPLQLELALIQEPKLVIDSMRVSIQPREGLLLKSAAAVDFPSPAEGATQLIPVSLQPQQQGVLGLSVTVLVNTERDSLSRSFAIPLIVMQPGSGQGATVDALPTGKAPAARP
jgi:hypothetical protein